MAIDREAVVEITFGKVERATQLGKACVRKQRWRNLDGLWAEQIFLHRDCRIQMLGTCIELSAITQRIPQVRMRKRHLSMTWPMNAQLRLQSLLQQFDRIFVKPHAAVDAADRSQQDCARFRLLAEA